MVILDYLTKIRKLFAKAYSMRIRYNNWTRVVEILDLVLQQN